MHSPRRLLTLARVAPLALAVLATPLLAPTCGGGASGLKAFSKGSIIIPMDECYQYDGTTTAGLAPCPDATTGAAHPKGDVLKAYGLVYQLVRKNVPVYWVIQPTKTKLDDVDMTVQLSSGLPAHFYNWNSPNDASTTPAAGSQGQIDYRGGPFVVDGSDFAAASAVMQTNKTTFQGVKVHVTNVAFQANVAKTMSGGWNAGGSVTPKLALLNIGSDNAAHTDAKNAEPIIQGYLVNSGLDFTGAGGTTAAGAHGVIYDKLTLADFQPAAGSTDWRTSNFGKGGYQVLWVPHWWAPGSCADASTSTNCTASRYNAAQIQNVVQSIGAFVKGGGDLMAECAGLAS